MTVSHSAFPQLGQGGRTVRTTSIWLAQLLQR